MRSRGGGPPSRRSAAGLRVVDAIMVASSLEM
jgi:hypothetical protein